MSNIMFQVVSSEEFSGMTILIDGEPLSVSKDHPEWEAIFELLKSGEAEAETLIDLVNPSVGVSNALLRLSERVTFADGTIRFDGDVIDNSLTNHIIKIIKDTPPAEREKDYKPFVLFLEKLYTNPSKKSRKHLYAFIEDHGFTIHPDGDFIAYKGVRKDGTSSHAGYGIVNDVVYEHANLPNEVGSVVEIPRDMVDNDREVACSTGLHVGTYQYANSFAPRLLTTKVNPRDVVSVPSDYQNAKIRVSRYVVLENAPTEKYGTATLPVQVEDDFAPDTENEAKPKKSKKSKGKSKAPVQSGPLTDAERVQKMKDVINALPKSTPLRRHRNKNVTPANRTAFDQAVTELGLSY